MNPAEVCDKLSSLLRAGYGLRVALEQLPDRFEDPPEAVRSAARRARLGAALHHCAQPLVDHYGRDLAALPKLLTTGMQSGSNAALALDHLAESIRARESARRDAHTAAAGATLSARMIAALPLLLGPVALRQISDAVVVIAVICGFALGVIGYRWLLRAIPSPSEDAGEAELADEVAAALRAGQSINDALRAAVTASNDAAVRKVYLGAGWADALRDDHPIVANAITEAQQTGTPIARSLERAAAEARREAAQSFERAVARAPVKMVVPLVCCVLPSFVLVAIVPLLRGLAHPV